MTGPYSARNIEVMADTLAHLCTLYVLSGGRETPLARDDVRGGRFADGGRRMVFNDGRRTLEELYVTRTALRAALETIQRARTGGLS